MRKIILVIIVVIILVILGFYFTKGTTEIVNRQSSGSTIVAFGDSLVEGIGARKGNDFVSKLSQEIGITIINEGVGGDTTGDGLKRIDDIISHDPKVVILLLGGNDALRKIPTEITFQNLSEIIISIQREGSAVILVGVQEGIIRDGYKKEYEKLAKEYGTGYIPNVLDGLIGKSEYMSDHIHPNDAGYVLIANKIRPVLEDILGNN